MQRKPTVRLLIAFLVICSGEALAASQPMYIMDARRVQPAVKAGMAAELKSPSGTRVTGQSVQVGSAALPGTILGETYYDWQHNGSTGRQVDEQAGRIQATWMRSITASTGTRNIYWNKASVVGSPAPFVLDDGSSIGLLPLGNLGPVGGQEATTGIRPGYTNYRNLPSGKGVAIMHDAPDPGPGYEVIAGVDAGLAVGVFIKNVAPQPAGQEYVTDGVIWPKGTVELCGADTVVHIVGTWSGAESEVWYWRGTVSGTAVTWSSPTLLDTAGFITAVVEAHGDSVVVAYTKPYSTANNDDVVYRLSDDCGLNFGPVVNVSNYTDASDEYAYLDLDLLIDPDGEIHIVWSTLFHDTTDGSTLVVPTNLNHWNSQRGTVRRVTSGGWENFTPSGCSQQGQNGLGSNTVMLSKMNLSLKPAGFGPGAGITDELLYCIWVQGGPVDTGIIGDCATQDSAGTVGGYVNMEIYWSVSSDDGFTWDRPQNVTGTKTPNCLPGDCHSENWVSAAELADSGVYISYTDDTHPAGAILVGGPQGEWSLGTYRAQALESRLPVVAPVIGVGPQLSYVELNTDTTGFKTLNVAINNLGNALLTFDVLVANDDGGSGHVLVNGGGTYSGSVPAGGNPDVLSIQYDGIGLPNPSEYNWRLEVTSNDVANDPGQGGTPIDIKLNVFVANPWFTCTSDTISTGQHRLAVGSCLELGDQGGGGGLYSYADESEWIFDASPVIARLDGVTKRAYRDIFWNSVVDRSRDSNRAFRAQSAITVNRNTTVNGKAADQASGVAYTTDSVIRIDWEVTAFREPGLTAGAVARYLVTNRTLTTYNGLILGAAADLDVDSLSSANNGITDDAVQYIGAQGGYLDADDSIFMPQSNFAALFNIPLDAGCIDAALGGQALDNVDYIYPENAYNTDTLYNVLERMPGWNAFTLQADTITDVNVVMTTSKNNTLTPAGSLEFAVGLAVSDVSQSDLKSTIALLKKAVNDACIAGCPIALTGDLNLTGTITSADIIVAVNYVFKGGPDPQPCPASADVNCGGTVTSADIIILVNYVFKGGPAPCDACISPLAGDC